MKSPADQTIIQIDGNSGCPKRCSNCTRLVGHYAKDRGWEMDLDTFKRAIKSMEGWGADGKVLGLIGGEITEHSLFPELARTFAEMWGGPLTKNGREPIKNYAQFVQERLWDRSSQRGLWTSLGPAFYRHMEVIYEVFSHFNVNTHEGDAALHQANLIHRKDYIAATGITDEEWERNRDNCKLQEMWSASIFPSGPYFCEQAGAIDTLYFGGKHAWPLEHGWWQRTPADFKDQLHLCDYCSLAQPGPAQLDQANRDIISKENELMLVQLESPAVLKNRFEKYDPEVHKGDRTMDRPDWYVGPEGRVSDEHASVRPKKLSAVIVAVNLHLSGCGEQLARTLLANRQHFDQVVVVHGRFDPVQLIGLPAELFDSIAWVGFDKTGVDESQAPDAFNKGSYLNAGLAALDKPDWILFLDADILLPDNFREFFFSHSWNPGCLYGFPRIESASRPGINDGSEGINGYAQLWHPRAKALEPLPKDGSGSPPGWWRPKLPETFCSAGGIDSYFMQQYPLDKRIFVPDLAVTHLDHGEFSRRWNGHRTDVCWRQVGVIYDRRFSPCGDSLPLDVREGPPVPVRLTDTRYGTQWEGETLEGGNIPLKGLLEWKVNDCYFQGRNIGDAHIHVAMRF